jgi:hypothetical protein
MRAMQVSSISTAPNCPLLPKWLAGMAFGLNALRPIPSAPNSIHTFAALACGFQNRRQTGPQYRFAQG